MNQDTTSISIDPDRPIELSPGPREGLIHDLLPTEIFTEIFQWCIPPFRNYTEKDPTSIPLNLGAVCQIWRTIAWCCPALWSSLTLTSYSNTNIPTLLRGWLSRAGELPLSIRLYDDGDSTQVAAQEVIDVLNTYSARWYEMDFRLPPETYVYLPSDTILPLLHYCSFLPVDREREPNRSNAITFSNTPELRHLSLGCSIVYPRSLDFQWELLTSFEMFAFFVDECLEILRQSPKLVNLSIHEFIAGDDDFPVPTTPFELSHLQNIMFTDGGVEAADFAILFDKLIAPGLLKFEYTGKPRSGFPVQAFVSFTNRSGCSLTSLSFIGRVPINEEDIIHILAATPALTSFSLFAALPLTDKIWRLLDPTSQESPHLVQHLESLEYSGPQGFSWQVLLDTFNARCLGPGMDSESPVQDEHHLACFKNLSLFVTGDGSYLPMPQSVEIGFDRLRKSGRKIDISICLTSLEC